MAYQDYLNVGQSEFAVSRAIKEISQHCEYFTQQDIAEYVGCSSDTVFYACKRLLSAGVIKREGSKRTGFRYKFIEDKGSDAKLRRIQQISTKAG